MNGADLRAFCRPKEALGTEQNIGFIITENAEFVNENETEL